MERTANQLELRKRAEEKAREKAARLPENIGAMTHEEIQKTIQELHVHQIELEMQNDELRRVQDELDSIRARYFDLYDTAPVGYCIVSEKGVILEANLTAAILLGVDRGALVKQPFTKFIIKDDQDIFYCYKKQLFLTEKPQVCELRILKDSSIQMWVRLEATIERFDTKAFVLENGENSTVIRVVLSDICRQKHIEEAYRNAQKLESLGILAGGIAHDFNNLLGGIFGYVDLAKHEAISENASTYLAKALLTMGRAREITQQLLTFAKGGAPNLKTDSLFPFVRDVVDFTLISSGISSTYDIPDNLPQCNFDRTQIRQVIENIIINAQQAMPGRGTIKIIAQKVSFDEKEHLKLKSGKYICISIKDFGAGISKEHLTRIYDPFFTTKVMGQGLGLTVCYSIVNRHGGFINVESEPGKGSTFHIYLPVSVEQYHYNTIH